MRREILIHYGGYSLSSIGAMFGVSLLSHIVPAEIYGTVALYIAIATLFQTIVRESLSNAIMRYSVEIREDKTILSILIKNIQAPLFISYTTVCLFCFFWIDTENKVEQILSFALILLLGVSVAGEAFLSSLLKRLSCVIHINMIQWLRFPLAAVFYLYVSKTTSSILLGFVIAFLLTAFFDFIIWKNTKPNQNLKSQRFVELNIFKGSLPVLIGFFVWFVALYDRIALEHIFNAEMLGIYFVLMQIAYMPMVAFMHSSANYLFPLIFDPSTKIVSKKNVTIGILILFSAWIFLFLTHQWLFSWLVGEQYRPYSWLIPWLFLAAILNAVSYIFHAAFYQIESMKTLLLIKGLVAVLYFCLVTLFAYLYAIEGVVFANVCVSLFLGGITWYFGREKRVALK